MNWIYLLIFLIMTFWGNFSRPQFTFEQNLSKEVVKKLTSTLTNRSLRTWRIVFILLALSVYGYHVYWTYYADDYNEQYQALSYKDLRNRRLTHTVEARIASGGRDCATRRAS